jgi:hypothetical protein
MPGSDAGSPPHVVGKCDRLGAIGQWENISPPGVPIPEPKCGSQPCRFGTLQVLVDPLDTASVYVGTDGYGVFKSTDCGATWQKINTGRNGKVLDSGACNSMAMDPVDPQIIYSTNLYGQQLGLLKSTNGGVDWDQLFKPGGEVVTYAARSGFAVIVSMDPTDHEHLVVAFHNGCTGPYAPDCLAETSDSGATWRLVAIPGSAGAEGNGVIVLDKNTWLYGMPFSALLRTSDKGATWSKVTNDGGWAPYRTVKGVDYVNTAGWVERSSDTLHWTSVQGSPPIHNLIGDGVTMFAGPAYCDKNCFYTSPEDDGTHWTLLSTPVTGAGPDKMAYDPDRHMVYSSNTTAGLWRVVTR